MKFFSPYIDSHTKTELYLLLLTIGRENLQEKRWKLWVFVKSTQFPLNFHFFLFCLWTSIGLWIVNILQRLNVDLKAGNEAVWLLHVGVGALFVDAAQLRHHSVEEQEIVWTDPESGPKGIGGWSYSSRKTFYISLL